MKYKAITGIMLTLILTSVLTVAFNIPPIAADAGTAEFSGDSSTIEGADGDNPLNLTDSQEGFLGEDFNRYASVKEDPKLYSDDEDRWNFNVTNEWADFANVDGDSAELVIGVNNGKPNSYEDIVGLIDENGGDLVGTVLMEGEIRAVVADIPLVAVSSFVAEVWDAGLSKYIEPNMKFQACFVPNDPYWSYQWGPRIIETDYAWNTTIGDPSVLVAVIDTGIDWDHPDLAANYVPLGYDWVNNDTDPMDDEGHGTHCAGIIAAVINNSVGIAGLAQVRIMAEKGLDSGGWGTEDDLANAIIHAVDQGANILSNSWGGYGESMLIHEAVKYAYDCGVLVVAAAGNDATSMKLYPAAYDEVIAVTATDEYDNPAWFPGWWGTNFGEWVELAAPGVDIYSTLWDDYYTYMSGTSMSTPHVAGVASLVWSQFPNMTRDQVRLQLRFTANDLGDPGFDDYYGYGRINARRAVEQAPPDHDLVILDWERPPYVEPGDVATVSTTVFNFGASNESDITVQLSVNGSVVHNATVNFLASGESATVDCSWSPTVEGMYNVTSYVVPVPGEMVTENNIVWAYVYVGFPVKAVVLDSAGNYLADIITNWEVLNTNWHLFGSQLVYIDYTTLSISDITYDDIAATGADVLIISCAYDWEFTDSEIDAITRYVHEGHGLIATAGTLYYWVPNNNKLAPLFGLNETVTWDATLTDLLHLQDPTHPLFVKVPNPYTFPLVGTALPSDGRWDWNELDGGTYVAIGHYEESAIVVHKGLVYISPWLEIIPSYYHHHLQLLYNAITWSTYQKPEHELIVSLECPPHLEPDESTLLNATVSNIGLSNETDVELYLSIDGAVVNSTIISELLTGKSYTISYWWSPTVEATYDVTAYTPPKPGEEFTFNNVESTIVYVRFARFVLWDDVHDNDGDSLTGNYLELYQLLTASGFIVDELTSGTINIGLLADYDILVLMDPELDFTPSEIADIQNWVAAGGASIIIPDGGYPATVNTLMAPYGVQLTGLVGDWGFTTNILSHPITQNVSSIYVDGVREISVTLPSTTLAWSTDLYAFLSATEGGEVIVVSDSNVMDNYGLGMADNTQLMLNIFNWVGVKYEHDLAVTLDAPKFLKPGDSSLLNATVTNRGSSNETGVQLFLLIYGTAVNSTTISELLTGASCTINYLWTPMIEATYNVTAYAPPVPGENITTNNVRCRYVIVSYAPKILAYIQYTDYNQEYANALGAIDSTFGPNYLLTELWDYTQLDSMLPGNDILFIPEQENADLYMMESIGATWSTTLSNFMNEGGVIILCDFNWGSGGTYGILTGAGLMSITGSNYITGSKIYLIDPSDPLASGVSTSFVGPDGSLSFITAETDVVFNDGTYPVVIHKIIGPGHIALIGFDYYASNPDADRILGNAVGLWMRYEHEIAVSLEAPKLLEPSDSTLLNATVSNRGLSNETNVELFLLLNGTIADNATIPELLTGSSYTLSFPWAPTVGATYNVTAYAPPVPGENVTANNIATKIVSVRLPRYVLFDQTHGTDSIINYNAWVMDLTQRGYMVYIHTTGPIDPVVLAGYDVFVIPQAHDPYTSDELFVIQNFVAAGVGLLVIGDDEPYIYTDLTGFAGISWMSGGISGVTTDITPHEVTHGVSSVYLDAPVAVMTVTGVAQDLVRDPAGNIMLAVSEQPGRVIGFADEDSLWNYGITQEDNLLLANNMIDWLVAALPPPGIHDVAIVSVTTSATEVYQGQIVNITVVAKNEGNITETFNVATCYDISVIGIQTVTNLTAGANVTLTFSWDTIAVEPSIISYTIKAVATPVPGEMDTTDNTYIDGSVKVKMVGDVNGDGIVDIVDVAIAAIAFGSAAEDDLETPWDETAKWNPVADLNGDGLIDIVDLVIIGVNFGERVSEKEFERTTVYVDPQSTTVTVGETFTVNVKIFNVTDLYGYEFKLYYDSALLDGLNVTLPPGHFLTPVIDPRNIWISRLEVKDDYNATHGRVLVAVCLFSPEPSKNGSGTLATITFKATALGSSTLDLTDTILVDTEPKRMPHDVVDGYVAIT